MGADGWTFADLEPEQVALVTEAERTLGTDVVMAYAPSPWGTVDPETVEDLAERATPMLREFSAKAAEILASAADKAAPLAHKAGEATADASGKLAEKSRSWAAGTRESLAGSDPTRSADTFDTGQKTDPPTTI